MMEMSLDELTNSNDPLILFAKETFDAAGLHTPTWNTKDSQGTLTLYGKSVGTAVKAKGKLATAWAKLKLSH